MWNPQICQDPPTFGQDDLVLLIAKLSSLLEGKIKPSRLRWIDEWRAGIDSTKRKSDVVFRKLCFIQIHKINIW